MSSNIDLLIDWFNDTIISYGNDKQLLIKKYDYFIENGIIIYTILIIKNKRFICELKRKLIKR